MYPKEHENRRWFAEFVYQTMKGMFPKEHERKIAPAVASSAIAATLLEGGRTAYSTFKLLLKICTDDVSSICNISKQSNAGKLMKDCSLIIWEKASMSQ
jgi:PIF1 helicase.